jgi:hypothetical protein
MHVRGGGMTRRLRQRRQANAFPRGRTAVRRTFMTCISPALLFTAILVARAEEVPVLDTGPVCRGIAEQASGAGERGGPDLKVAQCVKSEQATRERLVKEWSTFASVDKANCVREQKSGPLPSYTDLVSCLEMARDARKLEAGK